MKRRPEGVYDIGEFQVKSGELMVTDPCYSPDTTPENILKNVRNGTWEATIRLSNEGSWGDRVAELMVRLQRTHDEAWRPAMFSVGVDAGQVCIVDTPHFHGGEGEYDDKESFYGDACAKSMDDSVDGLGAGILKSGHGVNSSSGYGDGSYHCYYGQDTDGNITSVRVVFIPEEVCCSLCGESAEGGFGWDEDDMIDGACPSCRGRLFCDDCESWCHERDMSTDNQCKYCAPDDEEDCPNCDEHRETECRCGWTEGDPLEKDEGKDAM